MGLCPGVTTLQHLADCDVVTGSERQVAAAAIKFVICCMMFLAGYKVERDYTL